MYEFTKELRFIRKRAKILTLNEKTQTCDLGCFEYPHNTNDIAIYHIMRVLQFLQQQIKETHNV